MKDYYEILGVKRNATQEEIKKAYLNLCKQFHPDKFKHLGKEEYEKALKKFVLINEAFDILYDPQKRQEYTKKLEEGKTYTHHETSLKIHAQSAFKQGKEEFEKGSYARAIQYFKTAIKFDPEKELYKAYLAHVYLKDKRPREEILSILMKIYTKKNVIKDTETLYISAKTFYEIEEYKKAVELLEIAKALNPTSYKIKMLHEEINKKINKGIFKFFKF